MTKRAETEALAEALEIIGRICSTGHKLQHIKVATASSWLVDAMSKHVEEWIESGGMGFEGRVVAHYDRLRELHEQLDEMEDCDDGGIDVQFWHVEGSMNKEIDALANLVLD
jgi:ribonuclease HI